MLFFPTGSVLKTDNRTSLAYIVLCCNWGASALREIKATYGRIDSITTGRVKFHRLRSVVGADRRSREDASVQKKQGASGSPGCLSGGVFDGGGAGVRGPRVFAGSKDRRSRAETFAGAGGAGKRTGIRKICSPGSRGKLPWLS